MNNQGQRLHRSAPDQGSGCLEPDKGYDSGPFLHPGAKNHCSPFSPATVAVLHNRNDMSIALNSSDWVVTKGRVISRGVTSCAGMTEHVLLAQTKIGFLTGGRGYNFQELSTEQSLAGRSLCQSHSSMLAAWCGSVRRTIHG